MSPHRSRRIAAIDIGTVTTRLLIADLSDDAVVEVFRSTDITHLGEGLTASGRLDGGAMLRVAQVVSGYAGRVADYGAEQVTALATSASRDADNGEEFLALLAERGIEPQIITGSTEARLAFAGATWELEGEDVLVADLGGGSTELILGSVERDGEQRAETIDTARSIDVGSRRLTELFFRTDPPTPLELEEARAFAAREFRPFFDGLRSRPRLMVALAGTATTLSAIHQGLATYDPARVHGSCLKGSDLADLLEQLASLPLEKRLEVTGLDSGRAPVIVAGTLILETVVGLAGLDSTLVSEHDILYGMLLDSYRRLTEA